MKNLGVGCVNEGKGTGREKEKEKGKRKEERGKRKQGKRKKEKRKKKTLSQTPRHELVSTMCGMKNVAPSTTDEDQRY